MIIKHSSRKDNRTACKERYNAAHYDQIKFRTPKGSRAIIQELAAASGQSMAEYIRMLVVKDADTKGIDIRSEMQCDKEDE